MTRRLAILATMLAPLAFAACGRDSPLGPGGSHATMRVGANGTIVSTIGQAIAIDAAVVNSRGDLIQDAEIAWDMRSDAGVLVSGVPGRFTVAKEGTALITAIWTKDPSVRATVTITVDAGLLAEACIIKVDQQQGTVGQKCARQRVLVGAVTDSPLVSFTDAPLPAPLHPTTRGPS